MGRRSRSRSHHRRRKSRSRSRRREDRPKRVSKFSDRPPDDVDPSLLEKKQQADNPNHQ
jgi:hypothetical protein